MRDTATSEWAVRIAEDCSERRELLASIIKSWTVNCPETIPTNCYYDCIEDEACKVSLEPQLIRTLDEGSWFEVPVPTPWGEMPLDITYWAGTFTIAAIVMGACNAANLIDGLDGLLSGEVGITVIGLLIISIMMAVALSPAAVEQIMTEMPSDDLGLKGLDGVTLSGARIALGLAVLGAVLGYSRNSVDSDLMMIGMIAIGIAVDATMWPHCWISEALFRCTCSELVRQ